MTVVVGLWWGRCEALWERDGLGGYRLTVMIINPAFRCCLRLRCS